MVRQYERDASIETLEPEEKSRASESSPVWKKIVALGKSIPEAAWDNVPTDLARNWKYYKYGRRKGA